LISKDIEIKNKLGLHARAAAKLVHCAARFKSDIKVRKGDEEVDGEQCFRVRGVTSSNVMQTLSIEKRRFVIRRIRQILPLRSGDTERTIDYTSVEIAR